MGVHGLVEPHGVFGEIHCSFMALRIGLPINKGVGPGTMNA